MKKPADRFVIITAAGPDRPGIIARITQALFRTGCNIEDTSMTLLRGEFAMMLIVRLPEKPGLAEIKFQLKKVQTALGLSLLLKPLSTREAQRDQRPAGRSFILSVYGADKPGIVYRVTRLIASYRINITDMNTRVIGLREAPIYVIVLEMEIPKKVKVQTLQTELNKLKKAVHVDITLHPVESAQL
ncbi:MAG TPA: ACT domain-containing protein [Nitrospiria bacterium]|nr:ACT domain-containing protein [Nitrospiria bacterium]